MTEMIGSLATVNDDTSSTKQRIRRIGTSFKGMEPDE
jgi:hypothetical protein